MTDWPNPLAYQDALAFPSRCFSDPDLTQSVVTETALGLPLPISGFAAHVYRLRHAERGKAWAVRLFLRDEPGRATRYEALATHTALPACLVVPQWQPQGLLLGTGTFPLVKLDWIDGVPLNVAIEQRLNDRAALLRLAASWQDAQAALLRGQLAHGDLQHGNILVEPDGTLRLIDHDAVYLPSLASLPPGEVGHPSYQHPKRRATDYGLLMDRFPALVIYVALRAVAASPEVWYRLDNGDNLLFRREDFANPAASRAFTVLSECLRGQREELALVQTLRDAATGALALVPPLSRVA